MKDYKLKLRNLHASHTLGWYLEGRKVVFIVGVKRGKPTPSLNTDFGTVLVLPPSVWVMDFIMTR